MRMDRPSTLTRIAVFTLFVAVGGCASASSFEQAFSDSAQVKGNSELIPTSLEKAWSSTLDIASQHGFLVQQTDLKNHIILATKQLQDEKDKEISYTVNASVTFVPVGDEITRVTVAADKTTELHRKQYQWWHLLWLIPIFPVGTEYTTAVVDRDTIRSPQFYQKFFDGLNKSCCTEKTPSKPENPPSQSPVPDSGKAGRS